MNAALSVIVANFNNEKYIGQCLDSVLRQSYRDFEIVIADDCSSDSSPDIIRKYASMYPDRIQAIFHEKNHGVSRNRHAAIAASRGIYLTTLDSDDYYASPDKLWKEMDVIEHYARRFGRDVCAFSNTILIDNTGAFIAETCHPGTLKEGNIFEEVITRTCAIPRDFIMSEKAYSSVGGYDLSLNLFEDWDLKIRLAAKYEFYYSGSKGTAYRRHGSGLSSVPVLQQVQALEQVFDKNLVLVRDERKAALRGKMDAVKSSLLRSDARSLGT